MTRHMRRVVLSLLILTAVAVLTAGPVAGAGASIDPVGVSAR